MCSSEWDKLEIYYYSINSSNHSKFWYPCTRKWFNLLTRPYITFPKYEITSSFCCSSKSPRKDESYLKFMCSFFSFFCFPKVLTFSHMVRIHTPLWLSSHKCDGERNHLLQSPDAWCLLPEMVSTTAVSFLLFAHFMAFKKSSNSTWIKKRNKLSK